MRNVFITLFVSLSFASVGQADKLKTNYHLVNVGYDQIGQHGFPKVGYSFVYNRWDKDIMPYNFHVISADLGFGSVNNKFTFAPGLTYNFYGLFYFAGLNATYFTSEKGNDLRIAPQVGLSWMGLINVGYTYYLAADDKNQLKTLKNNGLILSVRIPLSSGFFGY